MTRLVRVGDFSRKKRTNIFRSRSEKYYIFRKVKNYPGRGVSCSGEEFFVGENFRESRSSNREGREGGGGNRKMAKRVDG